jgi:hypothetical protein
VIDGAEQERFESIVGLPIFSPDSRSVAYRALRDKKHVVVLDATPQPPFDAILPISVKMAGWGIWQMFSPDSRRFAYTGADEGKIMVIVDGTRGVPYNSVYDVDYGFSPGGTQLAYAARNGRRVFVVTDQTEHTSYDSLVKRALSWTGDGALVYCAVQDKHKFVVVADEEGKPYDEIIASPSGVITSPRIRYVAVSGNSVYSVEEDLPKVQAPVS